MSKKRKILTLNPGSTSLKIGVFMDTDTVAEQSLSIDLMDIVRHFETYEMSRDSELMKIIHNFLEEKNIDLAELDMIVVRGGPTAPTKSGAYTVNDLLLNVYRYSPEAIHSSMVGPAIAVELARPYGTPIIAYDFDTQDEADELPHITGLPEIRRGVSTHALNGHMILRQAAEQIGKPYEELNFIINHIGGGVSIGAHEKGRIIDSLFVEEGPIAPTRMGRMPNRHLITLCYSGKYSEKEMQEFVMQKGGLMAHLGTSDALEVEKRIAGGDAYAELIYKAMAYSTAKCIGEMAVALKGDVDAIVLTGGIARSKMLTGWIQDYVKFIAPIMIFPGEDELKALAYGGVRVLDGLEEVKEYDVLPTGYDSIESFYEAFNIEVLTRKSI